MEAKISHQLQAGDPKSWWYTSVWVQGPESQECWCLMARWDDVLPEAKRANSPFHHLLVLPTLKGLEGTPPALVRMNFTWSPIQMLCSMGNILIGTPRNYVLPAIWVGFLDGSMIKNRPDNAEDAGDLGSMPGSQRSFGGGNHNPLQYSCLGNPMDRGSMGSQRVRHDWACTHTPIWASLSLVYLTYKINPHGAYFPHMEQHFQIPGAVRGWGMVGW